MLALFGGTFDPIHFGHLLPVEALANQIGLTKIILLPNNIPPHRPQPEASAQQRVDMLCCAILNHPLFDIDTRELNCRRYSWTVNTLETLRSEHGNNKSLVFIIGQDSLLTLSTWYRWEDLLSLCHLIVCQRPQYPIKMNTFKMQKWLNKHLVYNAHELYSVPSGRIWLSTNTPLLNISSMEIRYRYRYGISCKELLPDLVINYINKVGLYNKV